jgi:FkbM family methyltransferase
MSRVDPMLYSMVDELVRPGVTVWDIGANVGLFSFCAAALSGPSGFVLSVEPDLWLAQLVGRSSQELSLGRSKCSLVQVLCASVSSANRITELSVSKRARSSNHLVDALGSTQAQGSRYTQLTVSLTLDFLLERFPPPSVVKIDVETHEANVLRGATRLLKEVRPTIWCEVSHENSGEVTRLLHEASYQLYGAATQPHMRTERAWFDTLGIPIESCVS